MPVQIAQSLLTNKIEVTDLPDEKLRLVYVHAVETYRAFEPLFSDDYFDSVLLPEFSGRFPTDPLLTQPEPESDDALGTERIKHDIPMLSTYKAYTREAVERFVRRIDDAGMALGMKPAEIRLRVTPKLDGIAGVINSHGRLLTRGQDGYGYDISRAFDRGLVGEVKAGVGELVLGQKTYTKLLKKYPEMKHPRNVVGGVMSADTLKPAAIDALESGDVRFLRYDELPSWEGSTADFLADYETIKAEIAGFDYCLTDGIVVEAVSDQIKQVLGATSHHHRWQIALKDRGDTASTTVTAITVGIGRRGNITPVIEYEPITLSGAVLSKVTGHSISLLNERQINVGAIITIVRSGEVIPHLLSVDKPSTKLFEIDACPSCGTSLVAESVHLVCPNNTGCPTQASRTLTHFFQRLKIHGFGEATVTALVAAGYTDLISVFAMSEDDFKTCIGGRKAENLYQEILDGLNRPVEDWLFLSAIGIHRLGRGDSRHLLAAYKFADLGNISADQIAASKGFGDIRSPMLVEGIKSAWPTITALLKRGFSLIPTPLVTEAVAVESPITNLHIVFTGKMLQGSRDEMKATARSLGANVQSNVNSKTDMLVCGERVGVTKTQKAADLGVRVISESEYLQLIV